MTKKFCLQVLCAALALAGIVLSGCATYGVGFSTMMGEITGETPNELSGGTRTTSLKQAFSSFSVFASNEYSEVSAGNLFGAMESIGISDDDAETVRKVDITGWTFNTYLKYPFYLLNDRLTLFPMIGADVHGYGIDGSGIGGFMPYLKVGGGLDFTFSKSFFLRGRVAYAPILITGMTFGLSVGFRTAKDKVKSRYKTDTQIKFERLQQKAKNAKTPDDWRAVADGYTQFIAKEPANAAYYFTRSQAYLEAKDYDASVKDLNKGAELGVILPEAGGQPQKWRQLYREYREAKGEEAPMNGRAIVIVPKSSHLQFVMAKTPGLQGAQGSGDEVMLKAGRQELVFRYNGTLNDLTAMTIGECTLTFDIKEGHVYTAVAGFNGRDFTIHMDDVTARETGLDEEKEPETVATFSANMFYTSRFKKGMTFAELRRSGFPETWESNGDGGYVTGIGNGDKRMVFAVTFDNEGLFSYNCVFFGKYKNEMVDLLSNVCAGPVTLDDGGLSWLSLESIIVMRTISNRNTTLYNFYIMPLK
jgi:hypothetical protein